MDFPKNANTPWWVYRRNQDVHWKQFSISVVEKDSEGNKKTTMTYKKCDGSETVPMGTELYFSDGKVKEK